MDLTVTTELYPPSLRLLRKAEYRAYYLADRLIRTENSGEGSDQSAERRSVLAGADVGLGAHCLPI